MFNRMMHHVRNVARCAGCWLNAHMDSLRRAALVLLVALLGAAAIACRRQLGTRAQSAAQLRQASAGVTAHPAEPVVSPVPAPEAEPDRWCWPMQGEILTPFAQDGLVWSGTLGQWQSHPAIDIAAVPGETVEACGDGIVADAWKDRLWGNVIVIDHGDGWRSTYANLNTLNLVSIGDGVVKGEIISAVGASADCESDLEWHLHFALERNGEAVDFASLMDAGEAKPGN